MKLRVLKRVFVRILHFHLYISICSKNANIIVIIIMTIYCYLIYLQLTPPSVRVQLNLYFCIGCEINLFRFILNNNRKNKLNELTIN